MVENKKHEGLISIKVKDLVVDDAKLTRKRIDHEKIRELAQSIEAQGLLNPLTVRKLDNGKYKLIAGYRRYLALKELKSVEAPVLPANPKIKNDRIAAIVENEQRESWTDQEREDQYYAACQERGDQASLAKETGDSESEISHILRAKGIRDQLETALQERKGELNCGAPHFSSQVLYKCRDIAEKDPELLPLFLERVQKDGYASDVVKVENAAKIVLDCASTKKDVEAVNRWLGGDLHLLALKDLKEVEPISSDSVIVAYNKELEDEREHTMAFLQLADYKNGFESFNRKLIREYFISYQGQQYWNDLLKHEDDDDEIEDICIDLPREIIDKLRFIIEAAKRELAERNSTRSDSISR